jgi:hypothetical protein
LRKIGHKRRLSVDKKGVQKDCVIKDHSWRFSRDKNEA